MKLQELTDNFAIPGVLAFDEPHAGMVRARVTTDACTAELYLQGAHVTQWQPAGYAPVLFLSERSHYAPGKAIRGGVPIVFPWFGPRLEDPADPASKVLDGPSHGFARTSEWTLAFAAVAGDEVHLTLTLAPNEASRALGYDSFGLAYDVRVGKELRLQLTVANMGTEPLRFEEALHTYLAVGDAQQVKIVGLTDCDYLDKTDGMKRKHQKETPLCLTGETDRPYLNTENAVDVDDPVLGRRIAVSKSNSQTTVVWNPWSELCKKLPDMEPEGWAAMTCIETANAAENALTLAPGAHHILEARVYAQHYAKVPTLVPTVADGLPNQ